jgi:hypothetical protein
MRKITKKIVVHISQTDNIIILIMSLLKQADIIEVFDIVFFTETHLDNQVLDSDIIIEGFENQCCRRDVQLSEL